MGRTSTNPFDIHGHLAGTLQRSSPHDQWAGLPWYAEDYTSTHNLRCKTCGQSVDAYPHNFNHAWATALIVFQDRLNRGVNGGWVSAADKAIRPFRHTGFVGAYALIERLAQQRSKGRDTYWRITKYGLAFVNGRLRIPKRIVLYLGNPIAFCGPSINFAQASVKSRAVDDLGV